MRAGESTQRARLNAFFENGAIEIIEIEDTRDIAVAPRQRLEGLGARIYLACDRGQTVRGLAKALDADEADISREIAQLKDRKLTLEISDRFLSLAVFRKRPDKIWGKGVYVENSVRTTSHPEQLSGLV